MNRLAQLRSWCKWVVKRQQLESDMDVELRSHLELYAEELMRTGISQSEAIRRARIEFGGMEAHKDEIRASLGLRVWDETWADLCYAARRMKKSFGFMVFAASVLAVGVGVNVAAFNQFNLMMLKPLPVRDPNLLFRLERRSPAGSTPLMPYPTLVFYGRQAKTLSAVMATLDPRLDLETDAQPVTATFATTNYFTELGISAEYGRLLPRR